MKRLLVGIDVGSTNIKCAIYDYSGNLVSIHSEQTISAYKVLEIKPQRPFIPEVLWKLTARTCEHAVAKISGSYAIDGIAVSSMGCSAILLDKQGHPVDIEVSEDEIQQVFQAFSSFKTNEIPQINGTYSDAGSSPVTGISPKACFEETGYPLDSSSTGFYLGAASKKDKFQDVVKILSVADYIAYRLTGTASREYSTAASMGIYSLKEGSWWRYWLETFSVDERILGTPTHSGNFIGTVTPSSAEQCGFPNYTRVYAGGHDYLCAALAATASDTDILNIFGTVEIMSIFTEKPGTGNFDPEFRSIIDHHVIPGRYSYMCEAVGAGNTEWLKRNIFGFADDNRQAWESFLQKVDNLSGTNTGNAGDSSRYAVRELFVPQIFGRIIPKNNKDLSGGLLFLQADSDQSSVMQSVILGLAFQSKGMYEHIAESSGDGKKPGNYIQLGGGAKRKSWVQTRADVLGLPIVVPYIEEASAWGAALLAGIGSGVYSSFDETAEIVRNRRRMVIEPDSAKHAYYTDIYASVYLPLIESLNQYENMLARLATEYRSSKGKQT